MPSAKSTAVFYGDVCRSADITVVLASAGRQHAEDADLADPDFVEGRGAGPEAWVPSP